MTIIKKLPQIFNLKHKSKSLLFLYGFDGLLTLLIIVLGFNSYFSVDSKNLSLRSEEKTEKIENPKLGVANPAAIYCQEMGYEYETVTEADGSQHGNCIFSEGKSCGDWDFYKGTCGKDYSYCTNPRDNKKYDLVTKSDGEDPFSYEYSACVLKENGKALDSGTSVNELMDLVNIATKGKSSFQERKTKDTDNENQLPKKTVSGFSANPTSFDWRIYNGSNWTTSVKNQGSCGSCWSYSAVGVVESIYDIATDDPNHNLNLSEQYHTSGCDSPSYCLGCCGGLNDVALELIRDNGIPDESCLPYVDTSSCTCGDDTCDSICTYRTENYCSDATCADRCSDWSTRLTQISSMGTTAAYDVPADLETMKADLIAYGPLSVAFDSSNGSWWYDDTEENIMGLVKIRA